MKAQREYGLNLSWARVTTVFLIDVALLVIASHLPDAWQAGRNLAFWVGVGLAVLLTIVALVTNGGVPVSSAPIARVRNWYAHPEALTVGCTPAIDHRRQFSRDTVGIREYDGQLIAVIAVDGSGEAGRHRHRDSIATIPLEAVVTSLRQFDVRLDSVDVISVGTRKAGQSKAVESAVRDDFGGERRPIEERSTWLVLRMDPQHNVSAVAARDSVACTLAAAAERLAHDLDGRSCAAKPLTADEIVAVDEAVLAGLQPAHVRPYWRYLKTPDGFVTSFWVSPGDITSETLEELWQTDADVTVMTIRIIADGRAEADVSVWVRYHSDKRLKKEAFSGLNRLTGRQLGAVAASLPAPTSRRPLPMPSRTLTTAEEILVPVGAVSGQQAGAAEALR
jgi:type VII secretion protein EccE